MVDVKMSKSVTLRDVAQRSGVSATTVSRILNNRESGVPIRDETRRRVLEAARDLGYKPNLLARGLRGSPSSLIGVIARDISDPFHIQILRGINEAASAAGFRLFLGHVDHRPEEALAYSSMFEHSHADGIIVIGDIEGGDPALDILSAQHRFVVGVTDRTERRQVPGVYADSATGTDLALNHLWSLGHRAIICVSDNRTYDGRMRIDRYERFMRTRAAAPQVFITDQEPGPAYALGRRLFPHPPPGTAGPNTPAPPSTSNTRSQSTAAPYPRLSSTGTGDMLGEHPTRIPRAPSPRAPRTGLPSAGTAGTTYGKDRRNARGDTRSGAGRGDPKGVGAEAGGGGLGFTGVFATSDTTAIGLMQAAYQAGIRVPHDVSIVGYDDIDLAPYTIPPLTTITQTGVEMGRAAAKLLLDMMDGKDTPDVVLTPRLIVRQSTRNRR